MKHKCANCSHEFEIQRPERSYLKNQLVILTGTGKNMAYVSHMNRDYALCPKCGTLEHQYSAEARDQSPEPDENVTVPKYDYITEGYDPDKLPKS